MVSSTLCPAVHILGSQNLYGRAEGIADHYWPWAVFFTDQSNIVVFVHVSEHFVISSCLFLSIFLSLSFLPFSFYRHIFPFPLLFSSFFPPNVICFVSDAILCPTSGPSRKARQLRPCC